MALLSPRTCYLRALPVARATALREPWPGSRLPTASGKPWPQQAPLLLHLTTPQPRRIDRPGLPQMVSGPERARGSGLVDRFQHLFGLPGRRRGLYLRNQVWLFFSPGLSEV